MLPQLCVCVCMRSLKGAGKKSSVEVFSIIRYFSIYYFLSKNVTLFSDSNFLSV